MAALRKERGLTQKALAERAGVQVLQVHRYESGQAQPSLAVIRELALTLRTTTDALIFGKDERGPDDELRLQFETISTFPKEEKEVVKSVLDSLILKHEAKRWPAR